MAEPKQIADTKRSFKRSILSISYDEPLLITREWILKAEGYDVFSVSALTDAIDKCRKHVFNLAIIGHSIPRQHKLALVAEIRNHLTPVLSIVRHGDSPLHEADYWVDSAEGPNVLVDIVKKILPSKPAQP